LKFPVARANRRRSPIISCETRIFMRL
jgi:hypothetical protein